MSAKVPRSLGLAELARHIFLEAYLEHDRNVERLYDYCEGILGSGAIDALVVSSYLLRMQILEAVPKDTPVLLTNEHLAQLVERLFHLSGTTNPESPLEATVNADVVAWEVFRVLVSRLVGPLDPKRFRVVVRAATKRREEVLRLRARCRKLSEELSGATTIVRLGQRAADMVDSHLGEELQTLLELDGDTWRKFLVALGSDKAVWTSIASTVAGLAGSGSMFTTAGAIGAVATIASTGVKVAAERADHLRKNDLGLLRLLKSDA